jgi:hypothetical protein
MFKELKLNYNIPQLNEMSNYLDNIKDWAKLGSSHYCLSLRGYSNDVFDYNSMEPNTWSYDPILKQDVFDAKNKRLEKDLQWTELYHSEIMKPIKELLEQFSCKFERVRIAKLIPKGVVRKHTDKVDPNLGVNIGNNLRIHLPIRTNNLCKFILWDKNDVKHTFTPEINKFYFTDCRYAHSVENLSEENRYHLLIDCYINKDIKNAISD